MQRSNSTSSKPELGGGGAELISSSTQFDQYANAINNYIPQIEFPIITGDLKNLCILKAKPTSQYLLEFERKNYFPFNYNPSATLIVSPSNLTNNGWQTGYNYIGHVFLTSLTKYNTNTQANKKISSFGYFEGDTSNDDGVSSINNVLQNEVGLRIYWSSDYKKVTLESVTPTNTSFYQRIKFQMQGQDNNYYCIMWTYANNYG